MPKIKKKLSTFQFLSLGYIITIFSGTILLMLPFATKDGSTNFVDALFTATSATCVTGLVVFDTFTHWTLFGQVIILLLIQIGGIGFMTIITLLFLLFKKHIGLYERTILMQSAGSYNIAGVVKLIRKIIYGTFIFEFIGAALLSIRFIPQMGAQGIWYAVFHSISAFCNAGFDLMGQFKEFSSFTAYTGDILVNVTIMALILIGGMGFIVWSDLLENKFNFRKYQLHTKIVLIFNFILVVGGAILIFIFEYNQAYFQDMSLKEKILSSFFAAVTPRTAGFNTLDLASMSNSSILLTTVLMFIGGNPGSTAGGVKVTTVVVVIANLVASAKNKNEVTLFKRKIPTKIIKQASSLFLVYFMMAFVGTIVICAIEPFSIKEIMFEVVSAIATVGLTIGITPSINIATKIILIIIMYSGRIGAFTLFSLFFKNQKNKILKNPEGRILVG